MPRPKGSKNKAKKAAAGTDFQALIAEKQAEKETLAAEIAALKEDLKAKNAALKAAEKAAAKLEQQQAAQEASRAEDAKKAELNETLQKLMASGMSAAEILEKLQ